MKRCLLCQFFYSSNNRNWYISSKLFFRFFMPFKKTSQCSWRVKAFKTLSILWKRQAGKIRTISGMPVWTFFLKFTSSFILIVFRVQRLYEGEINEIFSELVFESFDLLMQVLEHQTPSNSPACLCAWCIIVSGGWKVKLVSAVFMYLV